MGAHGKGAATASDDDLLVRPNKACDCCKKPAVFACPCELRFFCSRTCQIIDWKQDGHRRICPRRSKKERCIHVVDSSMEDIGRIWGDEVVNTSMIATASAAVDVDANPSSPRANRSPPLPDSRAHPNRLLQMQHKRNPTVIILDESDTEGDVHSPLRIKAQKRTRSSGIDSCPSPTLVLQAQVKTEKRIKLSRMVQAICSEEGSGEDDSDSTIEYDKDVLTRAVRGEEGSGEDDSESKMECEKGVRTKAHTIGNYGEVSSHLLVRTSASEHIMTHRTPTLLTSTDMVNSGITLNGKPFSCSYTGCTKQFDKQSSLEKHTQTHAKQYICIFTGCEEGFPRTYDLEKHMNTHTGEYKFRCTFSGCSKMYASKSSLSRHLKSHEIAC